MRFWIKSTNFYITIQNYETDSSHLSSVFEQSLFVLSTVQSVSKGKRAVLDCGMKGVSLDSGPPQVREFMSGENAVNQIIRLQS